MEPGGKTDGCAKQHNTSRLRTRVPNFLVCHLSKQLQAVDVDVDRVSGAARRRQRRLRQFHRCERLGFAMALAEFSHHTSRGQRMARAGRGGPRDELRGHDPDASSSPGGRCAALLLRRLYCVSGPQERDQRRTVAQIEVTVPSVPILDVPVPLMVCGGVGSVLSPWEPPPPHARARPGLEQAAGLHWMRPGIAQPWKSADGTRTARGALLSRGTRYAPWSRS